tara:strand:+ start:870 stop:1226 length:357 start_codon:yes stop_codon:yes gene_type:complete
MSKFIINANKGFKLAFANGWSISVQFGPMNYCDNQNDAFGSQLDYDRYTSTTAEIAILKPGVKDGLLKIWDDVVEGWCSTDDVAAFIQVVSNADPMITPEEMTEQLRKLPVFINKRIL